MKEQRRNSQLIAVVAVLSVVARELREGLYDVAMDEKGLLVPNHPLSLALWAVILAGTALIVLYVRKLEASSAYGENFGPSRLAALGYAFLGCTVPLMALLWELPLGSTVTQVWKGLGFVCGPALIWGGICRLKGKTPSFAIHAGLTVFLLLYLVSRYQSWSADPQLQNYVFELFALVCLVLFGYQCAAFAAGMGSRRLQLTFGLLTVLLWGVANFRAQVPALYFSGAVWAATNLCRPMSPRQEEEVITHDPA